MYRNSQRDTSRPTMPRALYQEVNIFRSLMCFWVHGTHNNALKNTKVTNAQ